MHRFGIIVTIGSTVALLAACSSSHDDNNGATPANDAGASATTTDDGGASVAAPAACDAYIRYTQRCASTPEAQSQACADGRRTTCSALLANWSATYQTAIAACETAQTSCEDGPDACIDQQFTSANVPPSAAQAKVRADYCASCAAVPNCQAGFFTIDLVNGDSGPGVGVLHVSDAVAQAIDAQCTGSALLDAGEGSDCVAAFPNCVADVASSAAPNDPDACYPASDDGGGTTDDASSGD